MAAGTIKSENVTSIEASPISVLDKKGGEIKVILDQDSLATTNTDDAGDLILFGPVPSNAVILDVEVLNDDLDSDGSPALAVNVGLHYSGIGGNQAKEGKGSGDVIDADCFASAATVLQAANVEWKSVRFEADDIVDVKKEAWEVGGLASDPGGLLYVGMTVTTGAATGAAGDVVVKVTYI